MRKNDEKEANFFFFGREDGLEKGSFFSFLFWILKKDMLEIFLTYGSIYITKYALLAI